MRRNEPLTRRKPKERIKRTKKTGGRLGEILRVLLRHRAQRGMTPEKLCDILEDLGPTFVKLGQIMSSRPDILPKAYCLQLERLRTNVSPMDFDEVGRVLEEELGRPIGEVFTRVDRTPLGSASIAQAHRARTLDGREVVLKLQRPNIRERMFDDIKLLRKAANILRILTGTGNAIDFETFLDEMEAVTAEELDFLRERDNLKEFADLNREVRYARCPAVTEFTTEKLVVMEYVDGIRIDDLAALRKSGYDLEEIAAKLADHYIKQIVDDGFFHADPHAGNILIADREIVWIDLGMMGRISEAHRKLFREGIQAVLEHDCLTLKNILLSIGKFKGADDAGLYQSIDRLLTKYGNMGMGNFDLALIIDEFMDLANDNNVSLPKGMTMFARGILTIESVLSALDPGLNIMEMFRAHITKLIMREFDWKREVQRRGIDLFRMSDKLAELPSDLSQYLKMNIAGVSTFNVELAGAKRYRRELTKFTVRIVLAILAAALLISAGLFAQTQILGRILDMSVMSFLLLMGAGLCVILLGLSFVIKRKKRRFKK